MGALATLNNQRQFDFQNNGIEVMDLETLQRTYKENDIYGNPVRGIYHYQVIQRMTDICRRHNLNYEVEEIFAAQNKNRTQPGVVILPQVEQTYGEKAVEAHVPPPTRTPKSSIPARRTSRRSAVSRFSTG